MNSIVKVEEYIWKILLFFSLKVFITPFTFQNNKHEDIWNSKFSFLFVCLRNMISNL